MRAALRAESKVSAKKPCKGDAEYVLTREPCVDRGQEGSKPLTMSRLAKLDKRLAHGCGTQRSRNETKRACMEEAQCLKQAGVTDTKGWAE